MVCSGQQSFSAEFACVSATFADLSGRISKLDQLHQEELVSTRNELEARARALVAVNIRPCAKLSTMLPHAPSSPQGELLAGHQLSLNSSIVEVTSSSEPLRAIGQLDDDEPLLPETIRSRTITAFKDDDTGAVLTDASDSDFGTTNTVGSERPILQNSITSTAVKSAAHRKKFSLRKCWLEVEPEALHACMERFEIKVSGLFARRAMSVSDFQALVSKQSKEGGDMTNIETHSSAQSCIVDCSRPMQPYGINRFIWTVVSLCLIAYDFLVVPLQAFDIGDDEEFAMVEWVTALLWTFDILLWFRTGYYNHSLLEMRPQRIAGHYVRGWFVIDLVIVASQWVSRIASLFLSDTSMQTSRLLLFLGFAKLIRVFKLRSIWLVFKERLVSNVAHYCSTVIILMLLQLAGIHIIACVWYLLGHETDGWPRYDEYEGPKDTIFWYVASARWVIAQLNGRTDIDERRNIWERFFTCVVGMFLAILAHAVWVSVITRTMLELRELMSEKTRRRRLANEYLLMHPVHPDISCSVKRYVNDYQDVNKTLEMEESVIKNLPKYVQVELLFEVRAPILNGHSLFHSLSIESLGCVRDLCHRGIKPIAAVQFEVVFDRGDTCSRMLFMDKVVSRYGDVARTRGSILGSRRGETVVSAWNAEEEDASKSWQLTTNKLFSTRQPRQTYYSTPEPEYTWGKLVRASSWVSEAALWTEWINRGRLVAEEHGQIYSVEATEFAGTLRNYREALSLASFYAQSMVEELRKKQGVSDLLNFVVELNELTPIQLHVVVLRAQGLANADGVFTGKSDPYCICKKVSGVVSKEAFRTSTVSNSLDPCWDHEAFLSVSERHSLQFEVWDEDFGKADDFLGEAFLDPTNFLHGGFEGELMLSGGLGKGSLTVKVSAEESDGIAKVASRRSLGSRHSFGEKLNLRRKFPAWVAN